jgi:hypothetical protein
MRICIKVGSTLHCYLIPVVEFPVSFRIPGPGPVNYPQLIQDAVLVASLQAAAEKAADANVRGALQRGVGAAVQALQKRGGEHVTVGAEGEGGGG